MRVVLLSFFTFFCVTFLHAQDTTKVLFIGNSITYFNDMPQTFEAIANSLGDATEVTMYAPGGTGFIHHVVDPNVYAHFQEGNWDYVVLQPGSNESPGYSEPIEETLIRAKVLKDSILEYNPCAKILYYEISYGVWGDTQADLDTYNTTMDLIRTNLTYLSDSTELFFAPAGESMRTAWNEDQTTLLWGGTGDIHPNARGSYLIACSFYASIFQKPSLGTNVINTLTSLEAEAYQELADTTVLNYLSDWRINTYNQYSAFDYTIGESSVNFTSNSENIDSLTWSFGDGNSSNLALVDHAYIQSGSYDVVLTTHRNGCSESITETIVIDLLETDDLFSENINLYPNPFLEKLTLSGVGETEVRLLNLLGQSVNQLVRIKSSSKGVEIDTTNLPTGVYILQAGSFKKVVTKK